MDESNTVLSAYTMYRHLQQYCSHPSICEKVPIGLEKKCLRVYVVVGELWESMNRMKSWRLVSETVLKRG